MICEDSFFYLPNLYTFQNGNSFYGSFRGLRFYIQSADNEHDGERHLPDEVKQVFLCCTWLGEKCLEESEVRDTACFPMDEGGYEQVLSWLDSAYHQWLGERPAQQGE